MEMFTTRDAATRLGVTPEHVARLCKQGRIAARRFGRDYLISEDSLVVFEQRRRPPGRPKRVGPEPA